MKYFDEKGKLLYTKTIKGLTRKSQSSESTYVCPFFSGMENCSTNDILSPQSYKYFTI